MSELSGIARHYKTGRVEVKALSGVDLKIAQGEFAVLMGPSGSGKSTLLNVIGCLDQPTSGTYILDGEDVTDLTEAELVSVRRNKLGFVFQSFHLVPRLTAVRNVELPMMFSGVGTRERRQRAVEALESVGLAPRADHRPDELSGGERQRVAIARALVTDPPVLLADEPTGNLDSKSGTGIMALLDTLHKRGRTIVMVTHNEDLARVGDRLVRLRDGSIEAIEQIEHVA